MTSCIKKAKRFLSIIKALISRSLFVFHGLISIWRVTQIKRSLIYWFLSGTLPLMVAETLYTLCKKKDGEWKWICPSVVLYLATSVPAIWFLELDLMRQRVLMAKLRHPPVNTSYSDVFVLNGKMIRFAISLGSEDWCKILEQLLLLILIIGRWLLPKGEITREQLSQLLLVYIGMAADIIELFEAFKEKAVRENTLLTIIILSLWTASLTQFTLVITATKAKKTRLSTVDQTKSRNVCCPTEVKQIGGQRTALTVSLMNIRENGNILKQVNRDSYLGTVITSDGRCLEEIRTKIANAKVISILISVFLQDAPFLVLRMLLIFRYDVLSYTNIFFTCKNSLVLVLQFYRLIVLFTRTSTEDAGPTSTPATLRSQSSLNTLRDAYDSSQSSDASSVSGKHSSVERRVRKLSRRRREMMRQMTEDSARTVSSSMDGADTTHSLEHECEAAQSNPGKHRSKASSAMMTARRNSATSPRSFKKYPTTSTDKKSTNVAEQYTNSLLRDTRNVEQYYQVQNKKHSRKGEVHQKIKQFETSQPLNDSDTTDHIISEDSTTASGRRHKHTKTCKASNKGAPRDSPRYDSSNSDGLSANRTSECRVGAHDHEQWASVRDLCSALAFLNESGKRKTLVVRSNEDGKMYVIEDLSP